MSETTWILTPASERETGELPDPWSPWYDKCFGMLIRAESEDKARELAQENARDETTVSPVHHNVSERVRDRDVWTDEALTDCVPISEYEREEVSDWEDKRVLMQDIHHA